MYRFRSLLIPVHHDPIPESVLSQATRLAGRDGARITLLIVVENLPWYARLLLAPADELQERIVQDRVDALEQVAGSLRQQGLGASVRVLRGRPAIETVREVLQGGHDLVIKEAGPNAGVAFGSVDMQLLRNCPCPVLLIRPGLGTAPFRRVLAAVDPVPALDTSQNETRDTLGLRVELDGKDPALDPRIVELAASLVDEAGELHVVHARSILEEWLLRGEAVLSREQIDGYVEDAHAGRARPSIGSSPPSPRGPARRSPTCWKAIPLSGSLNSRPRSRST